MTLTPPSNLTATSVSTSQIDLTWTNNDTYENVEVFRGTTSGSYTSLTTLGGSSTTHSDTTISTNTRYYYVVEGVEIDETNTDPSNEANAASWSEAHTETLTWTDVETNNIIGTQTTTETLTWSDYHQVSQTLKTDYGYYYGTSDGKVYEYSNASQSDAGTNILASWQSKRLDFADQYPGQENSFRTVYKIQLKYVDLAANTPLTVYLSGDGGVTWEYQSRILGTGDEKAKTADFHFMLTSQLFSVKVESSSTDKKFQILGIHIYFSPCGQYFEI